MRPWFEELRDLTERGEPLVLVTVAAVRGHAPREAGAKLLVTAGESFGTVGGGNLELEAVRHARDLLSGGARGAHTRTSRLTERNAGAFAQCCGGEVELLFEVVVPRRPCAAIFGIGHVGLALARVLSVLPIDLVLADTRAEMLEAGRLAPALLGPARVRVEHAPILDPVVTALPSGAHAVIMTHDHFEDLCAVEAALRRGDLGFIGLIGSRTKWERFRRQLRAGGLSDARLDTVTTPIGNKPGTDKTPGAIALTVAAQLAPLLCPPREQPREQPGETRERAR